MTSRTLKRLIDSVRVQLRVERERAYRRALIRAGFMPGSVELAVNRDREWIDTGQERV